MVSRQQTSFHVLHLGRTVNLLKSTFTKERRLLLLEEYRLEAIQTKMVRKYIQQML